MAGFASGHFPTASSSTPRGMQRPPGRSPGSLSMGPSSGWGGGGAEVAPSTAVSVGASYVINLARKVRSIRADRIKPVNPRCGTCPALSPLFTSCEPPPSTLLLLHWPSLSGHWGQGGAGCRLPARVYSPCTACTARARPNLARAIQVWPISATIMSGWSIETDCV